MLAGPGTFKILGGGQKLKGLGQAGDLGRQDVQLQVREGLDGGRGWHARSANFAAHCAPKDGAGQRLPSLHPPPCTLSLTTSVSLPCAAQAGCRGLPVGKHLLQPGCV